MHYYFRTMEDLFLEVFRRRAEEGLRFQAEALQSPQPLWALWRFGTDPAFTRISMEFMALANHRKEMRAEIAYYAERFREEQRQAVTAALQRYGEDTTDMPPVVWTVLMTSLSRMLVLEQAIGMSGGHAETMELVESHLRRLEGEPQPIAGMAAGLGGSPVAQRTEHALGAVLGYDDGPVHRQITVKPRRAGLRARARHDHRVVVGVRHVTVRSSTACPGRDRRRRGV